MFLSEALERRGYPFRQHLEEAGWTVRKLTVVDLDDRQRAALEQDGVEGLKRVLDEQGLWSFPAMDIEKPLPIQSDVVLSQGGKISAAVVAPASGELRGMAQAFIEAVEKRSGMNLPLLDGDGAELSLLQSQHIVLFGGSHESRFAMDMALRYQAGFVDGIVPGEGGWVVTTHVGQDASGYNVAQVAASPDCRGAAMACLLETLDVDGDRVLLRCTHRIEQGTDMRAHCPSWEKWTAGLPGSVPRFQGKSMEAPQDPAALADLLGQGLDSGGYEVNWYNAAPIDMIAQSAQYYQRSADPRALQLCRELLFQLADYYLKTPEGASYPADLDFRIGHAVLYYSRMEHEPIFSEEDRLILANLLLSCTRSIYEYTVHQWPIKPDADTRHNHETFAARSLMFAADYFDRYGVADVGDWRARTEEVFSGNLWDRFKQRENANHYEMCVFDHGAAYSAFTGRGLDLFDRECLRLAALRHVITTDNCFHPVDYGDAGPSMSPGKADKLSVIYASRYEDPTLQWFAQACFDRQHGYLPSASDCFTDVRRTQSGPAPEAGAWELLPLDPKFKAFYAPDFPQEYAFDKLAFRTGWGDDDHYLLFEGIGNRKLSHSHNDANGIVRVNQLGRHWVVSNGYGRLAGVDNVSKSFSTRVQGPDDHNTLVLRRDGEVVKDVPFSNALLQRGQAGDLAYATGALLGYSGLDWFRTLLILSDRFTLVVDRIAVADSGLDSGHIEWNCPGEVTAREGGFRVAQQGVFMDMDSGSGWEPEQGVSDRSADWKRVLESGAYPYASWPLKKLTFKMPGVDAGRTMCLATLLAATRSPDPAFCVTEPEASRVRVEAIGDGLPDLDVEDGDLSVRGDGSSLEVKFAPTPDVPDALRDRSA